MKTLMLVLALYVSGNAVAEPLATGNVKPIPKSQSYALQLTVSKDATPGIRFFPCIRFVLDDGSWIEGFLGCCAFSVSSGRESGGEIRIKEGLSIPAGRTLKYVAVVAAVGDPVDSYLSPRSGDLFQKLDDQLLSELKETGGVLLKFPPAKAEEAADD